MKLLFLVCLLGTIEAAVIEKPNECKEIMEKDGISDLFAKHVSHAIHSLTVEDLRMYFNKDAGENNNIPVVNHRLRDQPRVLDNAPMIGYDEEFRTGGMKHFDLIMKGIMMPGWNLTAFEVLEKLSHVYHMSEIWVQAGEKYKEVAKTLDRNSELCGCVRDMDSNGLAKYIQLTAFQIRYPGITSGNKEITDKYLGGYLDYHISYGLQERPKNLVEALMDFDFNDTDEALIPGVVDNLMDEAGFNAEPHDPYEEALHSQEHWEWCVGELKKLLTPELVYDTAVFMHCQLNLEK